MDFWVAYFQTNPIGFMIWKNTGEFVAAEVGPTLEVLYIYMYEEIIFWVRGSSNHLWGYNRIRMGI